MNKRRRHNDIGLTLRIKREKTLEAQRKRRPKLLIAVLIMLLYGLSGCMTFAAADEGNSGFYKLWTRKEAYCKYTGLGLEQIMKREDVLEREDVSFRDLRLDDGCFCAICTGTEEGDASDEIQISYGKQNL